MESFPRKTDTTAKTYGTSPASFIPSHPANMKIRDWLGLSIVVVALRWPLWSLPAAGRDEATYAYWAQLYGTNADERSYAPLLQILVRLAAILPSEDAWLLRLPSILCGVLALVLFERWLGALDVDTPGRRIAVAALALSPWQSYVGSILHPDALLLCALLAFALASLRRAPFAAALAAAAALWAKPTGLVVVLVAIPWLAGQLPCAPRTGSPGLWGRRAMALCLLLAASAPPLVQVDRGLVQGLLSFARLDAESSWPLRLSSGAVGLIFLGGPLLPLAMVLGLVELCQRRQVEAPRLAGLLMVGGFGTAALMFGQVKANWLLPAALLLWPRGGLNLPRAVNAAGLAIALLFSAAMTFGFARPQWLRSAEEALGHVAPPYAQLAGAREMAVSSTRQWWQRAAEYGSPDLLCEQIARCWPESAGVRWVLSDDYGLAAQCAQACLPSPVRLVLPLDPLFAARSGSAQGMRPEEGVLILCVRANIAELLPPGMTWRQWGQIEHPVTGDPVIVGSLLVTAPQDEPTTEDVGKRDR